MLTKKKEKVIKSLKLKKYRDKEKLFVCEGEKLIKELAKTNKYKVVELFSTLDNEIEGLTPDVISLEEMQRLSFMTNPTNYLAICEIPDSNYSLEISSPSVFLDDIQDPGNLGTIIRTCHWFGIKTIICSKSSVDCYNPKVVQSTMGALFFTNILYMDFFEFNKLFSGTIYAADMNGENLYQKNLNENCCFVFGNEGHGVSSEILESANSVLSIPFFGENQDSLNVGVSSAIFCSEYRRQTTQNKKK